MRWKAYWIALALLPLALGGGEDQARPKAGAAKGAEPGDGLEVPVVLPEFPTDERDAYLCTSAQLPDRPLKLVGISPNSDQRIVHHMLLFGCKEPASSSKVWDCRMASACSDRGSENVLYGWGKNAPAMTVPLGAGFSVGPGTSIRTVVLQIHYLNGRASNDTSGLTLHLSPAPVPNSAGMVAFAAGFSIPARTPQTLVENSCCYAGWEPLRGFATRVHTHMLGREVYLNRWLPVDRAPPERTIGLDPREPQGFYPIQPEATFLPGDRLTMACRFDSTDVDHPVHAGSTHSDEMCNLYLMIYSQLPVFMWCLDSQEWVELDGAGGLPSDATLQSETRVWQPPATLQAGKKGAGFPLGQVSGVASLGDGTLWVFHRGDTAWASDGSIQSSSSDEEGLLQGPTVLQMDQDSGEVLRSWGSGAFALPHMISLDWDGSVWVTDVVLHQAIKFSPEGKRLLALGTRMEEGDGATHFCRPTQVAVARGGNVYVADGYCNSRVAEFNASGAWLRDYQLPRVGAKEMAVPHSVVVHECRKQLLVADRENGDVHAFQLGTAKYLGTWNLNAKPRLGLPYALALGPYGSVLVLTWAGRDTKSPKTWVVTLGAHPGQIGRQAPPPQAQPAAAPRWQVPGVVTPHDLALAPAPLEITGAGERLLAVVVAETKESGGNNIHKLIFLPKDAQLVNSSSGGGGRSIVAEEEVEDAAAQSGTAPPGGLHAHDEALGGASGQGEKPSGVQASHIGHVMLKPVDGDSGSAADEGEDDVEEGQQQQQQQGKAAGGEAAHVGHSMVKPVEDEGKAGAGVPATEAAPRQGEQVAAPRAGDKVATTAGAAGEPGEQKGPDAGKGGSGAAARDTEEPLGEAEAAAEARSEEEVLQEEELAAAAQRARQTPPSDAQPAAAAERRAVGWRPTNERGALGHASAQPWMLAAVFVGVALLSWGGLQQWRQRSGAGYHPPGHHHNV